ncbi:hypothetical protein LguiB_034856 [Lonicera macranthoides]
MLMHNNSPVLACHLLLIDIAMCLLHGTFQNAVKGSGELNGLVPVWLTLKYILTWSRLYVLYKV